MGSGREGCIAWPSTSHGSRVGERCSLVCFLIRHAAVRHVGSPPAGPMGPAGSRGGANLAAEAIAWEREPHV